MNKRKIFNDPVYGFIRFPFDFLYDIIDHPYFQRLRRISQMGLSHYVYPGALHTRFHHALGALHLMTRAINTLRDKGIAISDEEYEAVCCAILLHDIGHGPFSHALEGEIIAVHHEDLSLAYMEELNKEFDGRLSLAIDIFKNTYSKEYLHQLVSSQLDMDRMDYLNRDSFFTGVAEGVIGYDRIIAMLNVVDNQLVVEEKGIYSIEKFLVARRIMYWQVYLHQASVAAESMLILFYKTLKKSGKTVSSASLNYFLNSNSTSLNKEVIDNHSVIDDIDILYTIKESANSDHFLLKFLSKAILERKLFRCHVSNKAFDSDFKDNVRQKLTEHYAIATIDASKLIREGKEEKFAYDRNDNEIVILKKNGSTADFSEISGIKVESRNSIKYFLCHPKIKC
jgi:HD superfamily phosphohydrolase